MLTGVALARADSDRDGSRRIGATGTTGKVVGSGGYGSQHESTNYGPHNTNLANKIDRKYLPFSQLETQRC